MSDYKALMIGERAPHFQANTTYGQINFPEDYKGKWVVLFSHPGDFTPVCTTELMTFASMADEFASMNTELLGLSVDSNPSHIDWSRAMERYQWKNIKHPKITFPIIADDLGSIARLYGMLMPTASETRTVRTVFIIDPNGIIRAILLYPLTTGRNIKEILRLVAALQAYDKTGHATPADWTPGDPQVLPVPQTMTAATQRLDEDKMGAFSCLDWYLCFTQGASKPMKEADNLQNEVTPVNSFMRVPAAGEMQNNPGFMGGMQNMPGMVGNMQNFPGIFGGAMSGPNTVSGAMTGPANKPNAVSGAMTGPANKPSAVGGAMTGPTNKPNAVSGAMTGPANRPNAVSGAMTGPANKPNAVGGAMTGPTNKPNAVGGAMTGPANKPNAVGGAMTGPTNKPNAVGGAMTGPANKPNAVSGVMTGPVSKPNVVGGAMTGPTNKPNAVSGVMTGPVSKPNLSEMPNTSNIPNMSNVPSMSDIMDMIGAAGLTVEMPKSKVTPEKVMGSMPKASMFNQPKEAPSKAPVKKVPETDSFGGSIMEQNRLLFGSLGSESDSDDEYMMTRDFPHMRE